MTEEKMAKKEREMKEKSLNQKLFQKIYHEIENYLIENSGKVLENGIKPIEIRRHIAASEEVYHLMKQKQEKKEERAKEKSGNIGSQEQAKRKLPLNLIDKNKKFENSGEERRALKPYEYMVNQALEQLVKDKIAIEIGEKKQKRYLYNVGRTFVRPLGIGTIEILQIEKGEIQMMKKLLDKKMGKNFLSVPLNDEYLLCTETETGYVDTGDWFKRRLYAAIRECNNICISGKEK